MEYAGVYMQLLRRNGRTIRSNVNQTELLYFDNFFYL